MSQSNSTEQHQQKQALDLEQFRRGLIQEIEAMKEALAGKRQQLSAVDKACGRSKTWSS